MSVVVDASILVAALIDSGPHGEWAEKIMANGSFACPGAGKHGSDQYSASTETRAGDLDIRSKRSVYRSHGA